MEYRMFQLDTKTWRIEEYDDHSSVYCYLLAGDEGALLLDTGMGTVDMAQIVRSLTNLPVTVLCTHGHFDHVGAVRDLAAEYQCDVYIHPEDLSMPPMMTAGPLYYTKTFTEGTLLHLAGLEISVLHTPGHTPGSVCLLTENTLFSGDTLFQRSCGRTDLPGGSWAAITKSLHRLSALEGNYWVFPGHGGSTTLRDEKKYNPYMQ